MGKNRLKPTRNTTSFTRTVLRKLKTHTYNSIFAMARAKNTTKPTRNTRFRELRGETFGQKSLKTHTKHSNFYSKSAREQPENFRPRGRTHARHEHETKAKSISRFRGAASRANSLPLTSDHYRGGLQQAFRGYPSLPSERT